MARLSVRIDQSLGSYYQVAHYAGELRCSAFHYRLSHEVRAKEISTLRHDSKALRLNYAKTRQAVGCEGAHRMHGVDRINRKHIRSAGARLSNICSAHEDLSSKRPKPGVVGQADNTFNCAVSLQSCHQRGIAGVIHSIYPSGGSRYQ